MSTPGFCVAHRRLCFCSFFDDGWSNYSDPSDPHACNGSPIGGPTEEDYNCSLDMGLTQADTTALTAAYSATMDAIFDAVADAGGWAWQMWHGIYAPTPMQCLPSFRANCGAGNRSHVYTSALFQEWTNVSSANMTIAQFWEDFASFQLVRGPYAFLGYAWKGCLNSYPLPAQLSLEYGEPTGTCKETAPAVASSRANSRSRRRRWTATRTKAPSC